MPEEIVIRKLIGADWLSAIGTIIQAIVAILLLYVASSSQEIAKQQKDITDKQTDILEDQINLALYERRFNIYQSLMTLISAALTNGKLTNDNLTEFWRSSKEAKFLLDDELNSYIQEVQSRANMFISLSNAEPHTSNPRFDDWLIKVDNTKAFFVNALDETPRRFEKYLGFKQVNIR